MKELYGFRGSSFVQERAKVHIMKYKKNVCNVQR